MKTCSCLRVVAIVLAAFAAPAVWSQTAITSIDPGGLTISVPGSYYLANDIHWAGQEGALAAITVTAPDVVLDMRGRMLVAPDNVPLSGTIGISADGADNFSLKRGTVKGFQLIGVALANSSDVTVSKVTVADVGNGVPGYTPYGISVTNCAGVTLSKIKVSNVNGSWFSPNSYGQIVAGVFLSGSSQVALDGEVRGVCGYSNVVSGVFALLCNGVTLRNLKIENVNGAANALSGASFGLSQNIRVEKCVIADLYNDAGVCSGIGADDCQHVDVLRTTVTRLSTGLTPNENAPGHTCIGMVFAPIRVIKGTSAVEVVDPGSLYNQLLPPTVVIGPPQNPSGRPARALPVVGPGGELEDVVVLDPGSGYSAAPAVTIVANPLWPLGTGAQAVAVVSDIEEGSASDVRVENCKITDIDGSCDDAHGISLFVVSDARVRRVTVERVSDGRGGRGSKATGIEIYGAVNGQPSNILVENCTVRDISARSPGDLQAAGYSIAGRGVTLSRCKASNVTVSGPNPVDAGAPGRGIGFAWAPDIRPEYIYAALEAQITNCTADNCQVGFDTFYFQNSTFRNLTSRRNGIAVKTEPAGTVHVLYCDGCSECPDAPQESPENWFKEVPVTNIASGNRLDGVRVR